MGLELTGVLDTKTLAQLKAALTRIRTSPEAVALGTKSARYALTEKQLARLGSRVGTAEAQGERA